MLQHVSDVVYQPCFRFFQLIRFLPDVYNFSDIDHLSTQQTHGLAVAGSSVRSKTLGFGVRGVFLDDVAITLDLDGPRVHIRSHPDAVLLLGELVVPGLLQPLRRIPLKRPEQVKPLWIHPGRMSERGHVDTQSEVGGFDLFRVRLPLVDGSERVQKRGTGHSQSGDGWKIDRMRERGREP
jgi:hypothetical protein